MEQKTPDYLNKFRAELVARRHPHTTIKSYLGALEQVVKNTNATSPETVGRIAFRNYVTTLKSVSYHKQACGAMRKYFEIVVGRIIDLSELPYPRPEYRLPSVLAREYIMLRLNAIPNIKHKSALHITYGCGLRRSETINLKISDIDFQRMMVRVIGKGNKERHIALPRSTAEVLQVLGHNHIKTTEIYTHVSKSFISKIVSPVDMAA